jgi:hypothetical protein
VKHDPIHAAVTGLSWMEAHEVRMGRTHWTREDYVREGGDEFDRIFTARRVPTAGERDHYARAFVDLHCPPGKMKGSSSL